MLGLAFQITADPSQADAALKQTAESIKATASVATQANESVVASAQKAYDASAGYATRYANALKETGRSAEQVQKILLDAGNSAQTTGIAIREAFGTVPSEVNKAKEATDSFSKSVRTNLVDLQALRMAFRSAFFFTAPLFLVSEFDRLSESIKGAAQSLGGFDEGYRQLMEDAVKANNALLTSFGNLTANQVAQARLIGDAESRNNFILQQRLANAERNRDDLDKVNQGLQKQIDLTRSINELMKDAYTNQPQAAESLAKALELQAYAKQHNIDVTKPLKDLEKQLDEAQQNEQKAAAAVENIRLQITETTEKQAAATYKAADATERLAAQEERFQAQGRLLELTVGKTFLQEQLAIMQSIASSRFSDFQNAIRDIQGFERAASTEEGRAMRESAREQSELLKQTEQEMKRHVQTILELQKALASGGTFAGVSFQALGQTFDQYNKGLRTAAELSGVAIAPISRLGFELKQVQEAAHLSGISLEGFSDAIGRNIAQAIVYGQDIGKAMETAAKAEAASIAARATIWGLYYTAHGIADLFWNPPRAAADFASAAEFFAIGGAVAALGAAIPSGSAATGSAVSASAAATGGGGIAAAPPPLASGSASAALAGQSQKPLQVNFNGPVYGGKAATREIIQNINAAVVNDRHQLHATHSITGRAL